MIQVLLMDDDPAALQKAVDREPSWTGQAMLQPDFPIAVKTVLIEKELPGRLHNFVRRHVGVKFQAAFRRLGTHGRQNRAPGELRLKQHGFQGVPEDGLIDGGIPVSVEHGKQPLELFVLKVASCGTVDDVPVEIHIAVAVVGLEVRRKGIVFCTVPYEIVGAPFLNVGNCLIHSGKDDRLIFPISHSSALIRRMPS